MAACICRQAGVDDDVASWWDWCGDWMVVSTVEKVLVSKEYRNQ